VAGLPVSASNHIEPSLMNAIEENGGYGVAGITACISMI
jgi:hypothetical protein